MRYNNPLDILKLAVLTPGVSRYQGFITIIQNPRFTCQSMSISNLLGVSKRLGPSDVYRPLTMQIEQVTGYFIPATSISEGQLIRFAFKAQGTSPPLVTM